MLPKGTDWRDVQKEYTRGSSTLKALAKKYNIHITTLQKKAKREGWVRTMNPRTSSGEITPALTPVHYLLGQRCDRNAQTIKESIASGWSPLRAFGACGFDKKSMAEWLKDDPGFMEIILSTRQAALGSMEQSLYAGALIRGSYDAALKYLTNAPETRDQYTTERAGGPKIEINIEMKWNRDEPPTIEGEVISQDE